MTTVIRQYSSPAAFPGTIVLNLEPAIDFDGVEPEGYFRFAKSREYSLKNQMGGANADMSTNNNLTVGANSVVVGAGSSLYVPGELVIPATIAVVFHQTVDGINKTLGGNPSTTVDGAGLAVSAGGNLVALSRVAGTAWAASLPKSGGDRWEMLFATFDNTAGAGASKLTLHRPRTGSKQEVTNATLPPSAAVLRLLGSATGTLSGAAEGAFSAYWPSRVLTDAQISQIYNSVKSSLQVSGLEI